MYIYTCIYIYIYIYTCQKHSATFENFISHPKNMIFKKQVNHQNVFIYCTKYKSSWATMPIKPKNPKNS